MMIINCERCQREIYGDVRTLHAKCFLDLINTIDHLNARIQELETQLGKRPATPHDDASACGSPGVEVQIVP
jgi:hypothetical protein